MHLILTLPTIQFTWYHLSNRSLLKVHPASSVSKSSLTFNLLYVGLRLLGNENGHRIHQNNFNLQSKGNKIYYRLSCYDSVK